MWTVLFSSLGQAQDPVAVDVIQQSVDHVYGKPVPKEAVCAAHPELPSPFQGAPTPVAVRRGSRGCVLLGVVEGVWYPPEAALAAAVDPSSWDTMDDETRTARGLEWVDNVLLAFAQPSQDGMASVTMYQDGRTVIQRQYQRREDAPGRAAVVVTK